MRRKTKKRDDQEHRMQCAVIKWRDVAKHKIKELWTLHACPNGGDRNIVVATRLKREGVTAGIPDLHLPVARGGYSSLYVEMKTPEGGYTPSQKEMFPLLEKQGNKVITCRSAQEAIDCIWEYLRLRGE